MLGVQQVQILGIETGIMFGRIVGFAFGLHLIKPVFFFDKEACIGKQSFIDRAELVDADLERHPGAQRRLLEDERQRLALESGGVRVAPLLDVDSLLEQAAEQNPANPSILPKSVFSPAR